MKKVKALSAVAALCLFAGMLFAAEEIKNYKQAILAQDVGRARYFFGIEKPKKQQKLIDKDNIDGTTSLIYAVSKEDIKLIEFLIESGASINISATQFLNKKYENTALLEAIGKKNHDLVKYLIDKGADVNYAGGAELFPLTSAELIGAQDIVKLLEGTGKLNAASYQNAFTVIMMDIMSKKPSSEQQQKTFARAKELIAKGASANVRLPGNDMNATLLIAAVISGDEKTAEFLIENGANINTPAKNGITPLMAAKGNFAVTKLLVDEEVDVNAQDENGATALMYAIMEDGVDAMEYLVENGALVNLKMKNGVSALTVACEKGNFDAVKFLVDNGSDFTGRKLISSSVNARDIQILTFLMKNGVKVKGALDADEAVLKAAALGNFNALQLLTDRGGNINAVSDEDKRTPIFYSAEKGNAYELVYFIEHGAKVNVADKDGVTPVMLAAQSGDIESAKLLVNAKADLTATTRKGKKVTDYAEGSMMKNYIKEQKNKQELEAIAWQAAEQKKEESKRQSEGGRDDKDRDHNKRR